VSVFNRINERRELSVFHSWATEQAERLQRGEELEFPTELFPAVYQAIYDSIKSVGNSESQSLLLLVERLTR
jgi:hypothetical protein